MSDVAIELKLESEQYERLAALAQVQQRSVSEMMQTAVIEWLERQVQMAHARDLMRKLGQGLAGGADGRSIARDHDAHLYSRDRI